MTETNPGVQDRSPILRFPEGFLWGAATSPFQVEGNVRNSDWWRWEQTAQPLHRRSGLAADHYNRFREDFDLAKSLGHNAHRLGIEWSRIEPKPGEFDLSEIAHYKEVLKALKERDMKVLLTLHHFTNPAWIADLGGWENPKTPDYYFTRFVKRVVPELGENVDFWLTINEPLIYTTLAFGTATFPPQKRNLISLLKGSLNMAAAHRKAYKAIHDEDPEAKVGFTNAVQAFESAHKNPLENLGAKIANYGVNRLFYTLTGQTHDFLGLDYYPAWSIGVGRKGFRPQISISSLGEDKSDTGWGIYPQGLLSILKDLKNYNLPIYITENGYATKDDNLRTKFIIAHLKALHHAIQTGVDVRGYMHWSLLDNMELHQGFDLKFGLIEVDFETPRRIRTPKPSAFIYKEIIENNGIPAKFLSQ